MTTMSADTQTFIEHALARSEQLDQEQPGCRKLREAGRTLLGGGLPEGRFEQWKYTRITPFYDPAFAAAEAAPASAGDKKNLVQWPQQRVDLQLPDAAHNAAPAQNLPDGLTVVSFNEADEQTRPLLDQYLNLGIDPDRHTLNPINMALLADGLLVHVAADTRIDPLLSLTSLAGGLPASCQRLLLVMAPGSRATLLEVADHQLPRNLVVEIHLGRNARLDHTRLQPASEHNVWQLLHCRIDAGAQYHFNGYAMAGTPHRNEIHLQFIGEQAEAYLRGAFMANGRGRLDHQMCIEHQAAHCRSEQQFHGIALDKSELTFNGRIHIHQHAQQTDARLSNKNLLGSDSAKVNTKPELEIYADDVKCAHGATVGQLDAEALFYLQSRGISTEEARRMLLHGFVGSVLPDDDAFGIGDHLNQVLDQWLG